MPDNTIRGRFAPSPSGRLHLGNMLTFLLAWLDVRARGGTMVFRLEDLDPERSWEHYADLMADDLLWLGLDWDEGWRPGSQDSRQGTRTERYTAALDALNKYFTINCMPVVSSKYWNMVHGNTPDEVRHDLEGMQVMRTLGRNMAWLLKCIEIGRAAGITAPEPEPPVRTNFIR